MVSQAVFTGEMGGAEIFRHCADVEKSKNKPVTAMARKPYQVCAATRRAKCVSKLTHRARLL